MSKIEASSVTTELLENAGRDFESAVRKSTERIETSFPNLIFQEKHQTGWLWNKRTYYTYWRYSEGRMLQLTLDSSAFIKSMEQGK